MISQVLHFKYYCPSVCFIRFTKKTLFMFKAYIFSTTFENLFVCATLEIWSQSLALSIFRQSFSFLWTTFYLKIDEVLMPRQININEKRIYKSNNKFIMFCNKVLAIVVLNIKRYLMFKFQLFFIVKFFNLLFVLIKNYLYDKYKNRHVKIEKHEGIPVKLSPINYIGKQWDRRFDGKYRRKLYTKAFFVLNKHKILHHFVIWKYMYIVYVFIKSIPKYIIIWYKYFKKTYKYHEFKIPEGSFKLPSILKNKFVKWKTSNQLLKNMLPKLEVVIGILKEYIQDIFIFRIASKKQVLSIKKIHKINTIHVKRVSRYELQSNFVHGLVNLKSRDNVHKKRMLWQSWDIDTSYFINMLKMLIIKLQYKPGSFYKATTKIFNKHYMFLFGEFETEQKTLKQTSFSSLKIISELFTILGSSLRYAVLVH